MFRSIINFLKNLPQKSIRYVKGIRYWSRTKQIIAAVIVIVVLVGGFAISKSFRTTPVAESSTDAREVTLDSVENLASARTSLPLVGTVTSISEATIRAQTSGQITQVNKRLGDYVGAGGVIAQTENSRERAALASAQAAASISSISGENQKQLLDEAKISAVNTIRSSYDTAENAVRTTIDPLFTDPTLANPKFNIQNSDNQLTITINNERLKLTDILNAEAKRRNSVSVDGDLSSEINVAMSDLQYVKKLVDDIIAALNLATSNQSVSQASIDAAKASVSGARSSWSGAISALSGAKDNLTSKQSAYDISLKQGSSAASPGSMTQAQANVSIAEANLEQTIIRSPISGTLNSFSLERGDFVTNSQVVAVVSNNGALEVKAFITGEDAAEIKVGAKATIDGTVSGVVTRVAPALDPVTKKIEVRIGVVGINATLLNGTSVTVSIVRTAHVTLAQNASITIPISAIKVTASGPVVFTVENGVLKSNAVTEGALLGDTVEIKSGLMLDMQIVTDARGLKDGDTVTVK